MNVNKETIKALSLFVAKKDSREYLKNIYFELQYNKTILTATNGAALLSVCIDEPNEKEDTFQIPANCFTKTNEDYEVYRKDDGKVYISIKNINVEVPQDYPKYPDFRKVMGVVTGGEKHYDPEYTMRFKKASRLLGGSLYPIIHRKNDIVDIGLSHVVGVQLSLRIPDKGGENRYVNDVSPGWLTISKPQ